MINRSSFYARSRLSTAFLSCTYSIGFLSLLLFTNHFTNYHAHATPSTPTTTRLSVTLTHAPNPSWMLQRMIDGKAVGSVGNKIILARRRPRSNGWSSRHTSIVARAHAHNVSCEHLCTARSCKMHSCLLCILRLYGATMIGSWDDCIPLASLHPDPPKLLSEKSSGQHPLSFIVIRR